MIGYKKVYGERVKTKFGGAGPRKEYVLKVKTIGEVIKPKYAGGKMRALSVKVLEVYQVSVNGSFGTRRINHKLSQKTKVTLLSGHGINRGSTFEYHIGKIVTADSLDPDLDNDCSNGINFFADRRSATLYRIVYNSL